MKILSASVFLLALAAADPALAGCGGGHGGYRSQSVRAPARTTVRKVAKKVEPKREAKSPSAATSTATGAAAVATTAGANTEIVAPAPPPGPVAASPAECKQYSAALGAMINVPCT